MSKFLIIIVVVAVVIGGALLFMRETSHQATITPRTSSSPSVVLSVPPSVTLSASSVAIVKAQTIHYTDSGYQPNNLTVSVGTKVTFVNDSTGSMWTASGPHPAHTLLPAFDALRGFKPGEGFSFTFTQVGEWPFHNHLKASHYGKITVQ